MSNIVTTYIIITTTDSVYSVDGDMSPTQAVANYSSMIPGLAAMQYTSTVETRAEGEVRVLTFSQRSGQKG